MIEVRHYPSAADNEAPRRWTVTSGRLSWSGLARTAREAGRAALGQRAKPKLGKLTVVRPEGGEPVFFATRHLL